jgi:hypothetical protein
MDSSSPIAIEQKKPRNEALERATADYNRIMEETSRYLKAIFCVWLALMLYITVDSRGEHTAGFLVFSAVLAGLVALGVRCVEWCEDQF